MLGAFGVRGGHAFGPSQTFVSALNCRNRHAQRSAAEGLGMTIEARDRDLELSRVFALAMQALLRQPLAALLIAMMAIYLPNFAVARLWPAPPETVFSLEFVIWSFSLIPPLSIFAIFQAWIAFQVTLTKDTSVAPHGLALSIWIPSIAAGLIVSVVGFVGFYALVIPGVIWGLACTVVIPAVARERLSPFDAIRRSFKLTENRRWAIFGFSLAVFIPIAIAVMLLELALVEWRFDQLDQSAFIAHVVRPITDTLNTALAAALSAAFYSELTRLQIRAAAPAT
jgi:hypothetical protein